MFFEFHGNIIALDAVCGLLINESETADILLYSGHEINIDMFTYERLKKALAENQIFYEYEE